ncbi:hypothetical protein BURPS1710b_A1884 [Burkholderia pseudomallei 1710b]|uniref:Uncharacterized protein n=1 Tax=Burkholderia pseudomallei (strain 1710b) TaxID=320372 RepID=Q3JHB3_BURP1|nr:hypothetical protein BURPS1710b_A1884 [Burkholderia pseudomallei 1710b]
MRRRAPPAARDDRNPSIKSRRQAHARPRQCPANRAARAARAHRRRPRQVQETAVAHRSDVHRPRRDLRLGVAVRREPRIDDRGPGRHPLVAARRLRGAAARHRLLRARRGAAARGRRRPLSGVLARPAARLPDGRDHADRVLEPDHDRSRRRAPVCGRVVCGPDRRGLGQSDDARLARAGGAALFLLLPELFEREDVREGEQRHQRVQVRRAARGDRRAVRVLQAREPHPARLRAVRHARRRDGRVRGRHHLRVSRPHADRLGRERGARPAAHDSDRADPVDRALDADLRAAAARVPRRHPERDARGRLARHRQGFLAAVPRHRARARRRLARVHGRRRRDDLAVRLRQHLHERDAARRLRLGEDGHVLQGVRARRRGLRHSARGAVAHVRAGALLDAAVPVVGGAHQHRVGRARAELRGRAGIGRRAAPHRARAAAAVSRERVRAHRPRFVRDRRADRLLVRLAHRVVAARAADRDVRRLSRVPPPGAHRASEPRRAGALVRVADRVLRADDRRVVFRRLRRHRAARAPVRHVRRRGRRARHLLLGRAYRRAVREAAARRRRELTRGAGASAFSTAARRRAARTFCEENHATHWRAFDRPIGDVRTTRRVPRDRGGHGRAARAGVRRREPAGPGRRVRARRRRVRRVPRDEPRRTRRVSRRDRPAHRRARRRADRALRGRIGAAARADRRRARAHRRAARAVRGRRARRRLHRRAHRPRARAAQAAAARRPAAAQYRDRPRRRVRRVQFSARVLGRGRRHGVRARGRVPGDRQGARRASRHVRARRPRDPGGGARMRAAGGRVLAAVRRVARDRPGARRRSAHQGGRLHGLAARRRRADAHRRRAARAGSRLRRDELDQSGRAHARRARRAARRDRAAVRRVAHARRGPVLHESGADSRDRRPGAARVREGRGGRDRRRRRADDAHAAHPRELPRGRRAARVAPRGRAARRRPRRRALRRARRTVRDDGRRVALARRVARRSVRPRVARRALRGCRRAAPRAEVARRPADDRRASRRARRAAVRRAAPDARAPRRAHPRERLRHGRRGRPRDGARRTVPGDVGPAHDVGRRARDRALPAAGVVSGRARRAAARCAARREPAARAATHRRRARAAGGARCMIGQTSRGRTSSCRSTTCARSRCACSRTTGCPTRTRARSRSRT